MKSMSKIIKVLAFFSLAMFLFFSMIHFYFTQDWLLTLAITFATMAYHFWMRLIVGYIVNKVMNNRADYTRKRYQLYPIESHLYEILKVKKWKSRMPSYDPELFSPKKHTWDEIAQAMCQAEVVHEIIIILSFVPILASAFFGAFSVFLWTSIFSALFDSLFVIMQRYNRQRVMKGIKKGK